MRPHLVKEVQSPDFSVLEVPEPEVYKSAVSGDVAAELTRMMELVVAPAAADGADRGRARRRQDRHRAAREGRPPHAWFIGFAPGRRPEGRGGGRRRGRRQPSAPRRPAGAVGARSRRRHARDPAPMTPPGREAWPSRPARDRYRLVERIAVGGMGEVWRAEDLLLGRTVAVKTLKAEFVDDEDFRRPASAPRPGTPGGSATRASRRLRLRRGDGTAWLVMELVDGEPLSSLLRRDGSLSVGPHAGPRGADRRRAAGRARRRRAPPGRQAGQPARSARTAS
jgi:hypothetical protein